LYLYALTNLTVKIKELTIIVTTVV